MRSGLVRGGLIAVAVLALSLTGCVDAPEPTPTPTTTSTAGAGPEPDPEIDLEGSASDNRPFFNMVNRALIEEGGKLNGRAFIDNLIAAGYPKEALEVTNDRTAINIAADNIQFSVRLNGTCLIGQYGNVGYHSTTATLLNSGTCLVGNTRPIDW
jgi:hypothetical protein